MMGVTLGLGLGVTHRQSEWFNSGAYADLAAIADFNNNQYALPAFGPELVVNGDFSSATSWTVDGPTGVSGGKLNMTNSGFALNTITNTLVAGRLYSCTFTVDSVTLGSSTGVSLRLGSLAGAVRASPGTYVEYLTYNGLGTPNEIAVVSRGGFPVSSAVIDNVSVMEVILTRGAAALGANLAASGYTMSVNGGTGTATESPTGQLNLTGDGTNQATGDKSFTTVVGGRYRVVCTVGTNACGISVGNTQGNNGIVNGAPAAVGFNSFEFTPTATTTWIRFFRTSASLSTITGIAVQELPATGAFPKRAATFAEWMAFTAASTTARSYVASDGLWKNALAANAPRFDFRNGKRQLRLEDARTNAIRNNSMIGAVAGIIGSGGVAPTGWAWDTVGLPSGITRSITGFGTENGLPYIDVSIAGTAGGNGYEALTFTAGALTSMSPGQTWTGSLFAKLIAGVIPAGTSLYFRYENASNGQLQDAIASLSSVNSTMQRLVATNATAPANTAQGRMFLLWSFATGISYNLTLRLYGPQLEQASFASDLMLTTSAAVTRAIETARFSPLLEAVMQRAAASVVVRGKLDVAGTSSSDTRVVVGGNFCRIITSRTDATARSADAAAVLDVTPASGAFTTGFGAAYGTDSAGQSLDLNAGTVGSNTSPLTSANVRTAMYLGRDIGAGSYGHGLYDFVGISPERLSNATLQALAVPA